MDAIDELQMDSCMMALRQIMSIPLLSILPCPSAARPCRPLSIIRPLSMLSGSTHLTNLSLKKFVHEIVKITISQILYHLP